MKTRSSFVSNSSSSSFIIALNKIPKSVEDVKREIFPDNDENEIIACYDESKKVREICERVFKDLKDKKPIRSEKKIIDEIASGFFEGFPEVDWRQQTQHHHEIEKNYKKETGRDLHIPIEKNAEAHRLSVLKKYNRASKKYYSDWSKEIREKAKKLYEIKYKSALKDKKVFIVSYADDEGDSLLEHSGIFRNILHVEVSHH